MNEKKTAEEAAYKFAEVILGQPAFDKDDTIVVGFLGGVEYAAQETAALREENERLKEALKEEKNKYNDLYNSVYTHFQTLIARNYNNIGVWSNEKQQYNFELISELEDILKSHNARKLTNHPNDSGK